MNFFMITPRSSDPLFQGKRQIVEKVSNHCGIKVHYSTGYPVYSDQDSQQSAALLQNSDFCIADLSYERPSCYFETGLAQCKGKPIDLIAQAGTTIHQVFNRDGVKFFKDLSDYETLIATIITSRIDQLHENKT